MERELMVVDGTISYSPHAVLSAQDAAQYQTAALCETGNKLICEVPLCMRRDDYGIFTPACVSPIACSGRAAEDLLEKPSGMQSTARLHRFATTLSMTLH